MKFVKFFVFIFLLIPIFFTQAKSGVDGLFLLQIEDRGQLWYVNPLDAQKYYIKNDNDALKLIQKLGLGITNKDFDSLSKNIPERLLGRILLKVEDCGKAYYINPRSFDLVFLGSPNNAFWQIAKNSVGASNALINSILTNANFSETESVLNNKDLKQENKKSIKETQEMGKKEVLEDLLDEKDEKNINKDEKEQNSLSFCSFFEEFYSNKSLLGSPKATNTVNAINYNWGQGGPNDLGVFNRFSARWTSDCYFEGGRYKFCLSYDDAVKVYLDGVNFIKDWNDDGGVSGFCRERNVEEGVHRLKIEYYDNSGWANIKFNFEKIN